MDLKSTGKLTPWVHLGDMSVGQHHKRCENHRSLDSTPRVLFSCPIVSDSLWPHGLQHTRPSCPSPSPQVDPSSCLLHWWCHPDNSSSDTLFSFCPQSFPASGTFPMSCLLYQMTKTGASASASVPPINFQGWSPSILTGLISLLSKGL